MISVASRIHMIWPLSLESKHLSLVAAIRTHVKRPEEQASKPTRTRARPTKKEP